MAFTVFSKNTEHLKLGIDLSMKQHTIIFKEACTILSHRLIKLCKTFRYVIIKNGPDLSWFTSVVTIKRLCKFLINSTKVELFSIFSNKNFILFRNNRKDPLFLLLLLFSIQKMSRI